MSPQPGGAVFANESFDGHQEVVFAADVAAGLRAIIAIHDTRLGPALGGCRMWNYDTEADAIRDALRLSRGMTYKNALAGLDLGGGKSVILGDSRIDKTPALLRAFGRAVDRLAGRYVTAEDVGITMADVVEMRTETAHVRGIAEGGVGDPTPHTAYGVFVGIRAAVAQAFKSDDLSGVRVGVQGLGGVGFLLAELLHRAGARLFVADIRADAVDRAVEAFGAELVAPDRAHAADVDVFAPCALGAVLNERSIPEIRARVVAGSANNQLDTEADGYRLVERGILYAPDYAINAGGVIAIAHEGPGFDPERLRDHLERIGPTLVRIFERAAAESRPTSEVADALAKERLAEAATATLAGAALPGV